MEQCKIYVIGLRTSIIGFSRWGSPPLHLSSGTPFTDKRRDGNHSVRVHLTLLSGHYKYHSGFSLFLFQDAMRRFSSDM